MNNTKRIIKLEYYYLITITIIIDLAVNDSRVLKVKVCDEKLNIYIVSIFS